MNCPWDVLPQVELQFCERVLCGWIRQPGNTLSNLGFLIVSFLVVRREGGRSALAAVAWASLLTGLGSAFFHASGSRIGGQLDYAGMFAGSAFMIAFNGCRWFRRPTALAPAAALFAVTFTASILWPSSERSLYIALGIPCATLEFLLWRRDRAQTRYAWYLGGGLLLSLGTALWAADISGHWCDPDRWWLSGHALWHWLGAGATYAYYRFYRQFALFRS